MSEDVTTWPRERVKWRYGQVGECNAGLWGFTETGRIGGGWKLTQGPDALLVEGETPYHFDRTGATEAGVPVPSTYAIPIPIEAFPALIERMQFALGRARSR